MCVFSNEITHEVVVVYKHHRDVRACITQNQNSDEGNVEEG